MFHERAKVSENLEKKYIGDIESYTQHIDFKTFLAQFRSEEEIADLEVQELLNIDYENLGELKERTGEIINKTTQIIENGSADDGKESLLLFFCDKLSEIKKNEINVQMFIQNIDKVDNISYGEDKTQIYFSN